MNARRVAALLRRRADLERELAQVSAELALAFDDEAPANDAGPKRRRATIPALPLTSGRPPTEIERQRALQDLRRLGHRVKP